MPNPQFQSRDLLFMRKQFFLTSLLAFCCLVSDAQRLSKVQIDSLDKHLSKLFYSEPDSVIAIASGSLQSAKELNYKRGIASGYRWLGVANIILSDFNRTLVYLDSAMILMEEVDDPKLLSDIQNSLGVAYEELGDMKSSLTNYMSAISLKEQVQDTVGLAKALNNVGKLYSDIGIYDSAITYLVKSLEYQSDREDNNYGSAPHLNLGSALLSMGDLKGAKDNLKRAIYLNDEYNFRIIESTTSKAWLAQVFFLEGDIDSALYYFKLARDVFANIGYVKGVSGVSTYMANAYTQKGLYDSAIYYLQAGLEGKESIGDRQDVSTILLFLAQNYEKKGAGIGKMELLIKESIEEASYANSNAQLADAYKFAGEFYERRGDYKKALELTNKHLIYRDSVLNEKKIEEVNRLETIFSVSQLEKDKAQLALEKEAQQVAYQAELNQQKIIFYAMVAVASLIFLLALLFYSFYRQKRQANLLLQQNSREIASQAERLEQTNSQLQELSNFKQGLTQMIAHDMKNGLNVIIGLSQLKPKEDDLGVIRQSGQSILRMVTNMLDVQKFEEAAVKLEKSQVDLIGLIEEARLQVELLVASKNIDFQVDIDKNYELLVDKEIMLRVLVNLLTNAIKYVKMSGQIILKVQSNGEKGIALAVIDNGAGIHPEDLPHVFDRFWQSNAKKSGFSGSTGLGLTFCKFAVEEHDGKISVDSKPGEGTTFTIELEAFEGGEGSVVRQETHDSLKGWSFSEEEFMIIQGYIERLLAIPVYKVSQLENILGEIDDSHARPVIEWRNKVSKAVYSNDQDKFLKLTSGLSSLSSE